MPTLFQEKYLKLPGPLRLKAQELNTVAQREISTSFCSVPKNETTLFQLEWDVLGLTWPAIAEEGI